MLASFDPPGASLSGAIRINASGEVVGGYQDSTVTNLGYIRSPSGAFTTFSPVGTGLGTVIATVNSAGSFTGYFGVAALC